MQSVVVVCGGGGQIGQALANEVWPGDMAPVFPTRSELDITDPASVARHLDGIGAEVSLLVNCAAYTAVDNAESAVAEAFLVNCQAGAVLGEACRLRDIPILHVSTDYVFDGTAEGYYRETDPVAPQGAYGASKLGGELAVRSANPRSIVLRTAWVVSPYRNNFVKTMLRLGGEREELRVVNDQRGCPTSAIDIARALIVIGARMVHDPACPLGIVHFVNDGEATWNDLAREVFRISAERGGPSPRVTGIPTHEYPTPARRPANSRLSTDLIREQFGIVPRDWRTAIAEIVAELVPITRN